MQVDISNNLIKSCTCGNKTEFTPNSICDVSILICNECGVAHQLLEGWDEAKLNEFYGHEYHKNYMQKTGHQSYHDRYKHDLAVAAKRFATYSAYIMGAIGKKTLDIGSSNSAFVHYALANGYDAWGLEPGDIGDDGCTIRGNLASARIDEGVWDLITMHDSIEHMVNIGSALTKVHSLLSTDGKLIIDLPNFWHTDGMHHWKVVEHLWFHNVDQMTELLNNHGFDVDAVHEPIPGKLVFYTIKV